MDYLIAAFLPVVLVVAWYGLGWIAVGACLWVGRTSLSKRVFAGIRESALGGFPILLTIVQLQYPLGAHMHRPTSSVLPSTLTVTILTAAVIIGVSVVGTVAFVRGGQDCLNRLTTDGYSRDPRFFWVGILRLTLFPILIVTTLVMIYLGINLSLLTPLVWTSMFLWIYLVVAWPERHITLTEFRDATPAERNRIAAVYENSGLELGSTRITVVEDDERNSAIEVHGRGRLRSIFIHESVLKTATDSELAVLLAHNEEKWSRYHYERALLATTNGLFFIIVGANLLFSSNMSVSELQIWALILLLAAGYGLANWSSRNVVYESDIAVREKFGTEKLHRTYHRFGPEMSSFKRDKQLSVAAEGLPTNFFVYEPPLTDRLNRLGTDWDSALRETLRSDTS